MNEKYADALLEVAGLHDFVWVQDYHLMLVADSVRRLDAKLELAYFHHIPFPSPDIFEKLPWRTEVLTAIPEFRPGKNYVGAGSRTKSTRHSPISRTPD